MRLSQPLFLALVLGNFAVLCGGFAIIGIMPAVIADFQLSAFRGGMLIAVYALTYALLSPLLSWLSSRLSYRTALTSAVTIACLGALLTFVAPNEPLLFLGRIIGAVGAAMFTPTAAAFAVSSSPPDQSGRALSIVAIGIPLSQVVGLPLAAWIGANFGWRLTFGLLTALLAVVIAILMLTVPPARRSSPLAMRDLLAISTAAVVLKTVLLTLTLSIAVAIVYTFQTQIFMERAGLTAATVGIALLVLGFGSLIGTWLTGLAIDQFGATRTTVVQGMAMVLTSVPMTVLSYDATTAYALALLAGAALFTYIPPLQVRLMNLAPGAAGLLFSVNASFVYLGSAVGGLISGMVVDDIGIWALGPISAACVAISLCYLAWLTHTSWPR